MNFKLFPFFPPFFILLRLDPSISVFKSHVSSFNLLPRKYIRMETTAWEKELRAFFPCSWAVEYEHEVDDDDDEKLLRPMRVYQLQEQAIYKNLVNFMVTAATSFRSVWRLNGAEKLNNNKYSCQYIAEAGKSCLRPSVCEALWAEHSIQVVVRRVCKMKVFDLEIIRNKTKMKLINDLHGSHHFLYGSYSLPDAFQPTTQPFPSSSVLYALLDGLLVLQIAWFFYSNSIILWGILFTMFPTYSREELLLLWSF